MHSQAKGKREGADRERKRIPDIERNREKNIQIVVNRTKRIHSSICLVFISINQG